ncbi:MAG: hypothetical protein Q9208_004286 [Pyrenodesmia sp. 3 TL-2023]
MTRRKTRPQQPKRIQVTDSEGWTHISRSGKRVSINHASTAKQKLVPSEAPEGQTLLDLQNSHAHYRDHWLSSPCHEALQKLFQTELPSTLLSRKCVDRCIILGLGSLSNGRRSSWWELVFFETTVETMFSSSPGQVNQKHDELQIYVQDPVFNDLDTAFLNSLGYAVLPSPEAFKHITPSTFLFAPHLEIPVYMEALSGPKPRLCIGTAIEECLDRYLNHFPRHQWARALKRVLIWRCSCQGEQWQRERPRNRNKGRDIQEISPCYCIETVTQLRQRSVDTVHLPLLDGAGR